MPYLHCKTGLRKGIGASETHVVVIGASGHARVIADIIECAGDTVDGFLDDRNIDEFPETKILGTVDKADVIHGNDPSIRFVIGIGRYESRERIAAEHPWLPFYTAIHPSAVIAKECNIGAGTVIMANAVVNTGTQVGAHTIINTAATVDHDCRISDFVHISPGAHISGTVEIGKRTWIGVGACVANNIRVCDECIIGAGSVVLEDIVSCGTYVGVPIRKIR